MRAPTPTSKTTSAASETRARSGSPSPISPPTGRGSPSRASPTLWSAGSNSSAWSGPSGPRRPPGAQARGELAAKSAAALDVQRLVDRLMRDPHGIIIREAGPQPAGDLLGAPRGRPAPVLMPPVTPADPADARALHAGPIIGPSHRASQPILDAAPQRLVHRQLGGLRTPGAPISVPLRRRRPVLQVPAAGRSIAPQLPRDRGSRAAGSPGDLPHPAPMRPQDRDLLPLGKGQVARRHGALGDRRHATSFAEPPRANRR